MKGKVVKMEDLPKGKAFIIDESGFIDKDGNVVESWTEVQDLNGCIPREERQSFMVLRPQLGVA